MGQEEVRLDLICQIEFGKKWAEASDGERKWCRNYLKEITDFAEGDLPLGARLDPKPSQ